MRICEQGGYTILILLTTWIIRSSCSIHPCSKDSTGVYPNLSSVPLGGHQTVSSMLQPTSGLRVENMKGKQNIWGARASRSHVSSSSGNGSFTSFAKGKAQYRSRYVTIVIYRLIGRYCRIISSRRRSKLDSAPWPLAREKHLRQNGTTFWV